MNSQIKTFAIISSFVLSVYFAFANKIELTLKSALAQSPTINSTEERTEETELNNIIVKANGNVLLQRDEETEFYPAYVGTLLYHGDVLKLEADAEVIVQCADLTKWNVRSGIESGVGKGCPKKPSSVLINGVEKLIPRGKVIISNTFHLISPRAGMRLLNDKIDQITIRWKPISEATHYTVKLFYFVASQDQIIEQIIWEQKIELSQGVDKSELAVIPANNTTLQEGISYFISIKAHRENLPPLEVKEVFELLNRELAKKLIADQKKIIDTNNDFTRDQKEISLASLYYSYSELTEIPFAEAIEKLEKLKQSQGSSVIFNQKLGDLYERVGLNYKAKECYLNAKDMCVTSNDTKCVDLLQEKLDRLNKSESL